MKKIFMTGATGYLGSALLKKLIDQGNTINVLVRKPPLYPELAYPAITLFAGDLRNKQAVLNAMEGCTEVYHVAGDTRIWAKDPKEIFETNIIGSDHVFEAALSLNVQKVVYTSTAGVIGPSFASTMTEDDPRLIGFDVEYELSKKIAEDKALLFAEKGLNIVIVCPSKIFGPGKSHSRFSTMEMIKSFAKKRYILLPAPGNYITNFCFIDDVVDGHINAMQYGKKGEKYILGGENVTHKDFFSCINNLIQNKGKIIMVSKPVVRLWALLQMAEYRITGKSPLFTPKSVDRAFANHQYSSKKATENLNYHITPLFEALNKTVEYLKKQGYE